MAALRRLIRTLEDPTAAESVAFFAVVIVVTLACVGYFQINLSEPGILSQDHLLSLGLAKGYVNGHGFRFNPDLGFPGRQDALYFPSFDLSYRVVLWLAARLSNNPARVFHILYIAGLSAMACAGYWTLRRLGVAAWLAVVGTLAATITPFLQERAYNHDFLALSFSAPLGLGLALQIGRTAPNAKLLDFVADPFVLVAILVVGFSGIYYAFYTAMVAVFVGIATALGERRWFPFLAAAFSAEAILVLLLFNGYGLDFPLALTAHIPQPMRAPYDQLQFGLNLADAAEQFRFIPKVATALDASKQALPDAFKNEGGAWPALPLTMTILATPLLATIGLTRLNGLEEPGGSKLSVLVLASTTMMFMLLFSVRGGVGYLFNLLVTGTIRSDARIMPFLTFGAVVILCLLAEIARGSPWRWLRLGKPVLVALLLAAAPIGDIGVLAKKQSNFLTRPDRQALKRNVGAMLAAKDRARLHAVLELPVIPWPEAPPSVVGYDNYEQALPYILDRPNSSTRWSYGLVHTQPEFGLLTDKTENLDALAQGARGLGFDGVLVDKKAYNPSALAALQSALDAQLDKACGLYEDERFALYALNCAPR